MSSDTITKTHKFANIPGTNKFIALKTRDFEEDVYLKWDKVWHNFDPKQALKTEYVDIKTKSPTLYRLHQTNAEAEQFYKHMLGKVVNNLSYMYVAFDLPGAGDAYYLTCIQGTTDRPKLAKLMNWAKILYRINRMNMLYLKQPQHKNLQNFFVAPCLFDVLIEAQQGKKASLDVYITFYSRYSFTAEGQPEERNQREKIGYIPSLLQTNDTNIWTIESDKLNDVLEKNPYSDLQLKRIPQETLESFFGKYLEHTIANDLLRKNPVNRNEPETELAGLFHYPDKNVLIAVLHAFWEYHKSNETELFGFIIKFFLILFLIHLSGVVIRVPLNFLNVGIGEFQDETNTNYSIIFFPSIDSDTIDNPDMWKFSYSESEKADGLAHLGLITRAFREWPTIPIYVKTYVLELFYRLEHDEHIYLPIALTTNPFTYDNLLLKRDSNVSEQYCNLVMHQTVKEAYREFFMLVYIEIITKSLQNDALIPEISFVQSESILANIATKLKSFQNSVLGLSGTP
jgi:hypothetical protein